MANSGHIIVHSGLKPVHSFDLFGPIVDAVALGEQKIALFEQIRQQEGISPEAAGQIIANYRALTRGEAWATGERKIPIIKAIDEPVTRHPDLKLDYHQTLQLDFLDTMRDITSTGEGVVVLTSVPAPWLYKALPEDLGPVLGLVYALDKSKQETFSAVAAKEALQNHRLVSHTEDDLLPLETAVRSGVFSEGKGRLIFVDRLGHTPAEQVYATGIDCHVKNLRDISYTRLVQWEELW